MKEQYVKPKIFFESFSLAQTIAKDCGDKHQGTFGQSNHYDPFTCKWIIGSGEGATILFFKGSCADADLIGDLTPEDIEDGLDINDFIEGMCYNNPDGGQSIFSST